MQRDLHLHGTAAALSHRSPARRTVAVALIVGLAYAAGSQLAFAWFGASRLGATFFPAAGVSVAALTMLRPRRWPAVIVAIATAEFVVDVAHGMAVSPTLGYVGANVGQALVAATLLRRRLPQVDLTQPRHLEHFLAAAVVAGPTVGACLGATTHLVLDGGSNWWRFAAEWWIGDGLGALVVAAAVFAWAAYWRGDTERFDSTWVEGTVLTGLTLTATALSFELEWFPLVYVPIFSIYLIAFRTGIRALTATALGAALIAGQQTANGHLLWEALRVDPRVGMAYLQLGLMVVITSAFMLCASLAGQRAATGAFAAADAARIDAHLAHQRAERLGRFAESLARAATYDEVVRISAEHGVSLTAVVRADAGTTDLRWTDTGEFGPSLAGSRAVDRMLRDALGRADLIAAERSAREGAELLAQAAARLAEARAVPEVAAAAVANVASLGGTDVQVWLREGDHLRIAASQVARDLVSPRTLPLHEALHERPGDDRYVRTPLHDPEGRISGVLIAAYGQSERGDQRSFRQLVNVIADQCGVALERARLQFEADRAANDDALLARLGLRLDRATTVLDRAHVAVETLVEELVHYAAIRLHDNRQPTAMASSSAEGGARLAPSTTVTLPLEARGRTLGALSLAVGDDGSMPRPPLLRRLVDRIAIAIDNAELYEHERHVSHTLQLGLLSRLPRDIDGLSLGAAYRPGTVALDVGGDWYDAFELPSGSMALVVGDAVGHDLDAAVAMSQLRGAVRALAPGNGPSALLERLDTFVTSIEDAAMATVVYVAMDPRTGSFSYACAGHPPPVVVSRGGTARQLMGGRSAPLGAATGARPEATGQLRPGDRLLLYTDGLVERRGESIDAGLQRLARMAVGGSGHPSLYVNELCDRMLGEAPQHDDVCVLVAERHQLVGAGLGGADRG